MQTHYYRNEKLGVRVNYKEIGKKIKFRRQQLEYTVQEMRDIIELRSGSRPSASYLHGIEQGAIEPNVYVLAQLVAMLQLDFEQLTQED